MATAGGQFSRIVRIGMKTKKRPPFTVSQTKGRRLYGQAGRQLWLTCTSYAGCAQSRPRWSVIAELCPVHPLPLRGNSPRWEACHWIRGSRGSPMNPVPLPPQGETRDMREKTASHILHVPFRCVPLWWLSPPPCPLGSVSLDSQSPTAPCKSSSLATRWEACHMI